MRDDPFVRILLLITLAGNLICLVLQIAQLLRR